MATVVKPGRVRSGRATGIETVDPVKVACPRQDRVLDPKDRPAKPSLGQHPAQPQESWPALASAAAGSPPAHSEHLSATVPARAVMPHLDHAA